MTDTQEIHRYVPDGYDRPTTVLEALKVGRAILAEENRWRKQKAYSIENPGEDPSTPFCDSWMVCSVGALEVSIIGLHADRNVCTCNGCKDTPWYTNWKGCATADRALYDDAIRELDRTIGGDARSLSTAIITYNDARDIGLADVLKVWDDTIARLEVAG